jgi:membrane dipeptidase
VTGSANPGTTSDARKEGVQGGTGGSPLIIDGLLVSKWGQSVFEGMHAVGLVANCTCSVWESFDETMRNIGWWRSQFREHDGLIRQIRTVDDIHRAYADGRAGVILGFQNTSAFEGRVGNVAVFHELGVRIVQLTYNFQNDVGSGCYEKEDHGLTEFGRDLVAELERVGILVDLSHVGEQTSWDAVEAATGPIAITHAAPRALRDHHRNKSDELMKAVAETGGIVGVTPLSWFMPRGLDSTMQDYLDALEYTLGVVGEDHVVVGTDITEGHGREFLEWTIRHRGDGRLRIDVSPDLQGYPMPADFAVIRDIATLPDLLRGRGWTEERIEKVLSGNWLRLFGDVWR